ncbi:MAG: chemotaxis protein CheW [Rhodobacteraceae bacterium]|nr:chemotaxis protein CheW [Paracoccaceae bacterium]
MTRMKSPDGTTHRAELELLSFRLGEQDFCVDIRTIREIRGWTRATPLPHAPPWLRGLINLRGTVLPVIDLSSRLGMAPVVPDARNVIIVAEVATRQTGLLVDAVSDIVTVSPEALQPPPALGDCQGAGCVAGLAVIDDRMLRLLDLHAVLAPELGVTA